MLICKVTGSVVSTRKNEKLVGNKFMIVEKLSGGKPVGEQFVAIDDVGAGIGETVLVVTGSAARLARGQETSPVDAAIVGIIDEGIQ